MKALDLAKGSVERAGRDDDVGALDSIRAEIDALLPYADPMGADYEERSKLIAASCFELSGRIAHLGGYFPV